ncbi:hypothetical protein LJR084_007505 [Variovorax sp. LjRoot84]|uniref:hypothetical protein n=1 Tax=Variovorax sp. LjRoot84 TaxID=3342340 RepID=UPI003ED02704
MTMTRDLRRFVCRLLIGVLVFAQMAIAAYACPTLSAAPESLSMVAMDASVAATPGEEAAMVGCDQIDNSAPNLCAEHCRFGQQSADHTPAPTVPAALLTTLYTLPVQPEHLGHVRPPADMELEQVAASPPLAILHCCFRI